MLGQEPARKMRHIREFSQSNEQLCHQPGLHLASCRAFTVQHLQRKCWLPCVAESKKASAKIRLCVLESDSPSLLLRPIRSINSTESCRRNSVAWKTRSTMPPSRIQWSRLQRLGREIFSFFGLLRESTTNFDNPQRARSTPAVEVWDPQRSPTRPFGPRCPSWSCADPKNPV